MPPKKKPEKPEVPFCDCDDPHSDEHSTSEHAKDSASGGKAGSEEQLFHAIDQLRARIEEMQGSQEYNHDRTGRRLGAIEEQIQDSSELTSARGLLRPLESFSGKETEDVYDFIQRFNQVANFQRWNEGRKLAALPLYLTGNAAVWFNGLTEGQLYNIKSVLEALAEQFDPQANRWLLRQQLDKRVQGAQELISDYATDIKRLCQRLKLPKDECLHCFTRGLKPSIKNYVYLQQPKTFAEAEYLAKLKSSISDTEPQVALMSQMGNIVNSLKDMAIQQAKAPTNSVAAFGDFERPRYDSRTIDNRRAPVTSDRNEPVRKGDLQQMIRELRREIWNSNRRRQDNFSRNRRTATGEPICNACGRVGHISVRCRSRDPRIPNPYRGGRPDGQRNPQGRRPLPRNYPNQGN